MKKKVAVGMSGGVDSSVTAAVLKEHGYEVKGIFIEAYNEAGCRTDEDKRDALQVATKLNIPFEVLDLKKEYKERVVKYFVDEYREGRTPNPDVVCNGEIKFGLFLDYVLKNGYDYLATGHYARITKLQGSKPCMALQRPKDLSKDQTYFLWKVPNDKLKNVLFPLGEMNKSEVRAKAKQLNLPNANKPDSMGVCMMGELSVYDFLKDKIGEKVGKVVWKNEIVGNHKGSWFYTIGQRGGWEVNPGKQTADMPPLYVIKKDISTNQLIVGTKEECYSSKLRITNLKLQSDKENLYVRIRNLGELTQVKSIVGDNIMTEHPIFAPAPGQSAVLYKESGIVAGGGIIC